MARVLAVASDLLLGSRVEAALGAAGHEVILTPSLQGAQLDGVDLVVADLDAESPGALAGLEMPVLGYYSHVDVGMRDAARAAGIEMVVPRSRMARELPELAQRLLNG